jgi:hypothetical protein
VALELSQRFFADVVSICFAKRRGIRTVQSRHLPFLHALLHAQGKEAENLKWLPAVTAEKAIVEIGDAAIRRFLVEERVLASR